MAELGGASIVGGAAVEVSADLSKLRQGFDQAKRESAQLEKSVTATIQVGTGAAGQIQSSIASQITRQVVSATTGANAAPNVAQIAVGADPFGSWARRGTFNLRPGPGEAVGGFNPFTPEGFGRATGIGAFAFLAGHAASAGADLISAGRLAASPIAGQSARGQLAGVQAAESIPGGSLLKLLDAATGLSRQFELAGESAQRMRATLDAVATGNAALDVRGATLAGSAAGMARARGAAEMVGLDQQIGDIREQRIGGAVGLFGTEMRLMRLRARTEQIQREEVRHAARQESGQAMAQARSSAAIVAATEISTAHASMDIETSAADAAHRREELFFMQRGAVSAAAFARQEARLRAAQTSDQRSAALIQNDQERAALNAEDRALLDRLRRDRARASRDFIDTAVGARTVAGLRTARQYEAAAVAQIRQQYRPQLEAARREFGTDGDEVRELTRARDAQITERVIEARRQSEQHMLSASGAAVAARLRIGGQNRAAQLAQYDANAIARLRSLEGRPEFEAERQAQLAGRGELMQEIVRDAIEFRQSMVGRREVAALVGAGRGQSASIVANAYAGAREIRAAEPARQDEVRETVQAEMAADRQQVMRVAAAARSTEFDPRFDVIGAPSAREGIAEVLSAYGRAGDVVNNATNAGQDQKVQEDIKAAVEAAAEALKAILGAIIGGGNFAGAPQLP